MGFKKKSGDGLRLGAFSWCYIGATLVLPGASGVVANSQQPFLQAELRLTISDFHERAVGGSRHAEIQMFDLELARVDVGQDDQPAKRQPLRPAIRHGV